MGLRTDSIPRSVSFKFFNKIISCGRRRKDQGLGPPPLWSVAGEGGLRSGLEGSVVCGGRGLGPRPEPVKGDGERKCWACAEQSCHLPNWPLPTLT